MGTYNREYYLKHKEELKEKQRIYYQNHKEDIVARREANREEYLAKRREWNKNRSEERKQAKMEYSKAYVEMKKTPTAKLKKMLKPLKEKYKGFSFDVTDGTAIVIEVKLPFRIFKYFGHNRVCDDKAYGRIQNELRRRVSSFYEHKNIIIIECQFIQIHILTTDKIEELCAATKEFIDEKFKIYGQYTKNGKKIASSLELNVNDLEEK